MILPRRPITWRVSWRQNVEAVQARELPVERQGCLSRYPGLGEAPKGAMTRIVDRRSPWD